MEEVVKLLAPINTTKLEGYAEGTDIEPWMRAGVPGELLSFYHKQYPVGSLYVIKLFLITIKALSSMLVDQEVTLFP